jgi:hypothetical protein
MLRIVIRRRRLDEAASCQQARDVTTLPMSGGISANRPSPWSTVVMQKSNKMISAIHRRHQRIPDTYVFSRQFRMLVALSL